MTITAHVVRIYKFKETGSVKDVQTPVRARSTRSAENIVVIR